MLHFCSVWGPLETHNGNWEFLVISYSGRGGENFVISEWEFPVALVTRCMAPNVNATYYYVLF